MLVTNAFFQVSNANRERTGRAAHALSRYDRVETLAFDYGQRHKVELDARLNVL
ncbi:7-cyano-7-deazaguanine synthase, partial [Limnohabitans sp.]|uniref:7-cyano-7-deazaguanine synthase n=1 Tax=Limnohabitans sp. TaxID=1907725 RepID=UPI00387EB630